MRWDRLEGREMRRLALPEPAGRERPRPDLPPGTDLLPQIKHIVVLMMENHSYDNYLGMLHGRGEGFPLAADGKPDVSNPGGNGGKVRAHHLASTRQVPRVPAQTWHATHVQWDGGTCEGFVRSVGTVPARDRQHAPGGGDAIPMGYWDESDLPFYYGLAETFPLADRWFSSCLGPTFPNRRFLISGTANGLIDDLPFDIVDYPENGTIFDMLTRHGISWVNYHPVHRERVVLRRLIGGRGVAGLRRLVSLGSWFPPLVKAVRGNKTFTADLYPLGLARCMLHLRSIPQFLADADAGNLPSFCIVDPDFDAWSEENPQDIRRGESFAAEIINRVMHGPAWRDTLLIWTYDEHGGYYDHVPPPEAVPPDDIDGRTLRGLPRWLRAALRPVFPTYFGEHEAEDAGPKRYDRLGFRVPAVIVSPYAKPGYVTSEVYDHTSVLKLVELKWNLPPLTRRDAAAAAPLDALDFGSPPPFLEPPDLPAPSLQWGSW
ncbi:MAG: alkaline phosphatase family protein [Gemmatimonadota bacterium]